ncbi:hypothetical protein [Streptomyces sp. bgisy060]|uniref:hypothetical protein n=1 Tax=Streptomyces sp. bgisy060 TaxID=3413775 RepID=UPI003EBA014A
MNTEAITINGTEITLTAAGFMTWTASDINLRVRPDVTWRATRGDLAAIGTTAQEAADNLIAAERKADKAAKLTASSTKGQTFAREMRAYLHISPRTRRHRKSRDLHAEILECITNAARHPGFYTTARQETFRAAYDAWLSYDKHIAGYRANGNVISHINNLSPHQFCAFIGEMVDAGITNVGEGERYFAQLARDLFAQTA